MQERITVQHVPVKVYRSDDRLSLAAPMPGMDPVSITVEVRPDGHVVLDGALRGALKGIKDLLIDEWNVGSYHRELDLPAKVDATRANLTYGNGVVVLTMPLAERWSGARITLDTISPTRGVHVGSQGHSPTGPAPESTSDGDLALDGLDLEPGEAPPDDIM